ncbi:MAG TPA: GNAT family N-acetyltransferase [Acidimicrobiales bacterium]|nr:GNAT family N-acetyltransferase [Acidimicrobiales bacterium]
MELEVRTIDASEIGDWVDCMGVGFLRPRAEGFAEFYLEQVELGRTWGAFDSGNVVGTLRSFATTLTVPGPEQVEVAALTNVTVAPTHRRRGILTDMIRADLAASVERSESLSILIASEYPIYGRFGYGPAVDTAVYTVDATSAHLRRGGTGSVELVALATLRKEAPALYDEVRVRQPGWIGRADHHWDTMLHQVEVPGAEPSKAYAALYRSESGQLEGYLLYEAEAKWQDWRPCSTLKVDELVAVTPEAYRRLWQYCTEVDLVTTVNAADRPVVEPLEWMLTERRAMRQSGRYDFLWVRPLDVCAALSARRYLVESGVVMEVTDDLRFADGRYLLEGSPRGAACSRTSQPAELVVGVDVLGALYLGGVSLRSLADAGRVEVVVPGALERADLMFRSAVAPWCSTWF